MKKRIICIKIPFCNQLYSNKYIANNHFNNSVTTDGLVMSSVFKYVFHNYLSGPVDKMLISLQPITTGSKCNIDTLHEICIEPKLESICGFSKNSTLYTTFEKYMMRVNEWNFISISLRESFN